MASNYQTVFSFLKVTQSLLTIDLENLKKIRLAHDNIKKKEPSSTIDDQLKKLADEFMIVNDATNLDHLKICVESGTVGLACQALSKKYTDTLHPEEQNSKGTNQILTSTSAKHSAKMSTRPAPIQSLSQATCQILIKDNREPLIQFIENFLLSPLDKKTSKQKSNASSDSSVSQDLIPGSVLDVFIRHQLSTRGDINSGRPLSKFPLVDSITLVDEFDTWHFDHLHGLFELNLIPVNQSFPDRWTLTPDAKLSYKIDRIENKNQGNEQNRRNVDRPSTASLENFVEDICEKENNGMAIKWIDALHAEDLFTYDHLANLKYTEWLELRNLSTNGKKILKSYIDREKQMAADIKSNKNQTHEQTQSECELLAHIHQIKLYFHYILAEQFSKAQIRKPAKLDADCVNLAFIEMHNDGFVDDGLFDQMKPFFLPLTMTEEDLLIDASRWEAMSDTRLEEHGHLIDERKRLTDELQRVENEYYNHDDSIKNLKQIQQKEKENKSAENETEYKKFTTSELIQSHREDMNVLEKVRNGLQTEIQSVDDLMANIKQGLKEKNADVGKKINRSLIKPNRGFIMYGPPGTGKSEIMRKLSTRVGINMVTPPIAAGELNRPLVGESERIISDICMRCHRIPYLMCCVSIDEIDSLTPKRKDDSRDGNIAKLSVLLSVIDGIKDVPNLMIFCATNRLHTMDEAFLRRMQGKFFLGRPSSHARKSILSEMKPWHMPPDLIESLTMATTNFSGSALRALCSSITAHCVDAGRTNSRYQLDYRKMLELADKTAKDSHIYIGAETLPTLLLQAAAIQKTPIQLNDLPNKSNSLYTGKIIVNFNAKRINIEMINIDPKTKEQEKIVYQELLSPFETNLDGLIPRLTAYGKSRNVQLLQIIDLNLLTNANAYDEKEKFEILKERLDECQAYHRSMIVYDLDSLVGVNRSEENSATGRSTNFSLINHNAYIYVKDKFQNAYIQLSSPPPPPPPTTTTTTAATAATTTTNDPNNTILNKERWAVMVIRDPFLVRQFCDDIDFTRSTKEIEDERAAKRRANEKLKCVQCNDFYIEDDNKMGTCKHHDGFVYDNHSLSLHQWTQRAAIEQLLKEEAEIVKNPIMSEERKEKFEREKQRFKFICCNQIVQITSMIDGGCKRGSHSPSMMTQDQWEDICRHNEEYMEKRMALLSKRIPL